jgi:hypothetical protein
MECAGRAARSHSSILHCRLESYLGRYVANLFVTNLNASLPEQPVGYPLTPYLGTAR